MYGASSRPLPINHFASDALRLPVTGSSNIVPFAADAGLRARIATAGSAFIRDTFDWRRAVSRMEEIFR